MSEESQDDRYEFIRKVRDRYRAELRAGAVERVAEVIYDDLTDSDSVAFYASPRKDNYLALAEAVVVAILGGGDWR